MRSRVINGIITVLFLFLIGYLWYFQCARNSFYRNLSERNRVRLVPLSAPRGSISDRKGRLLVGSRIAFDLAVIPQEFKEGPQTLERLGGLIGLSPDEIKDLIRRGFTVPFASVPLRKDVGKEEAIRVAEQAIDIPGFVIETRPVRSYPLGDVGSHVFGYTGLISGDEYKGLKDYGYKIRDRIGRGGIENVVLSGRNYASIICSHSSTPSLRR